MVDSGHVRGGEFHPPPAFWDRLPSDEKAEFIRLRNQLHASQQGSSKDSRLVSFRNELTLVLKFLERDESHREARSILAGIAFAGPFICVNTRLLKSFLGRCKSSINGGFQQMGYVALKTKTKARNCIVTVMRTLSSDQALLRQWTVRGASPTADTCFVSSFPVHLLPEMSQADLVMDTAPIPFAAVLQNKTEVPRPLVPQQAPVQAFAGFDENEWAAQRPTETTEGCQQGWGGGLTVGRALSEPIDDWVRMMNEWSGL
jgi:hypothetical protein